MPNIFKFYRERIKDHAYRGKHFRGRLDKLAEMKSEVWPTTPGHSDGTVSEKNTSETAFQRALYTHPQIHLVGDGHATPLTWKDIELPVILSKRSRRRCVDLIGQTPINGTFLCELKYVKSGAAPPGNAVDYAIFEALLYYAIVNRDPTVLDKAKVYHPPESPRFSWKAVSDSRVILVLANDYYWTTARQSRNLERITNLVADIRKSQDIQVLLCSTPNYTFKPKDVAPGRYRPTLALCAAEIAAAAKSFPTYRLIASSD